MKKFFVGIVAYDGTDFLGWQAQRGGRSIVQMLETSFFKTFREKINIQGASRTDAGVHALGQTFAFSTTLTVVPTDHLWRVWQTVLPASIFLQSLTETAELFNPLHDVKYKVYDYYIFLERPLPSFARYGWYYRLMRKVNVQKFTDLLSVYHGTHNFRSFIQLDVGEQRSTIKTIFRISTQFFPSIKALRVRIIGDSFGRYQIRRMVGYALDVARRPDLSTDFLVSLLENPNPQQDLVKADGSGLFLDHIVYNGVNNLEWEDEPL